MVNIFKILGCFLLVANCQILSAQTPKKTNEFNITETIKTLSSPSAELLKRAIYWVKIENDGYNKIAGITTSSKAECTVAFPVKQDDLNPECDYTGKITM